MYLINPVKFKRLVVWIKQAEKNNYEPAVIIAALDRFLPYAQDIENWYPYLDKICYKAYADLNQDEVFAEHDRRKEELREASKTLGSNFLRGIVKNA